MRARGTVVPPDGAVALRGDAGDRRSTFCDVGAGGPGGVRETVGDRDEPCEPPVALVVVALIGRPKRPTELLTVTGFRNPCAINKS